MAGLMYLSNEEVEYLIDLIESSSDTNQEIMKKLLTIRGEKYEEK